ncbi:MAG: translation initiation factor IF-2 subunit alpha, partial [Thermoplasmata archaeon]
GLDKKWAGALTEVARENIELPSVSIHGVLELTVPTSDGIDHIKKALAEAEKADEGEVKIHYLGAPRYRVTVTAEDYKTAEAELKSAVERATTTVHRAGGHASFKRSDEK